MARIPIALQLYSVREDCAKDLRSTIEAVAKMGYEGVEFAGYYDYSAADLKQLLDDNGLVCAGTHTQINTIQGDQLRRSIEFNQVLGNPFLVVPGVGNEYRGSKANLERFASELSSAAQIAQEYGAFIGYHNHDWEFAPQEDIGGQIPMRFLFENTPDNVILQLDTGNALHGGLSAEPLLEEFPGRSKTIHLKEYSSANPNALIGEGDVNWQNVFAKCESVGGTEFYIVEVEVYPEAPLVCAQKSLQAVKAMGK
jgi:sugar phosphate isomerase/epimerase